MSPCALWCARASPVHARPHHPQGAVDPRACPPARSPGRLVARSLARPPAHPPTIRTESVITVRCAVLSRADTRVPHATCPRHGHTLCVSTRIHPCTRSPACPPSLSMPFALPSFPEVQPFYFPGFSDPFLGGRAGIDREGRQADEHVHGEIRVETQRVGLWRGHVVWGTRVSARARTAVRSVMTPSVRTVGGE